MNFVNSNPPFIVGKKFNHKDKLEYVKYRNAILIIKITKMRLDLGIQDTISDFHFGSNITNPTLLRGISILFVSESSYILFF